MKVSFTTRDFKNFRAFEDAVKGQFGNTAYVGTEYAMVLVEYPQELKAALRPHATLKEFELDYQLVKCKKCKGGMVRADDVDICDSCREKKTK